MSAGAIIVRNAHPPPPPTSSWPPKKVSGNKFKRKFIETKSRSSGSGSSATTHPVNTTLDAVEHTPVNHPVWGTKTIDGTEEDGNSTATTVSCPPCEEPTHRHQTIGFLTQWINAYIFLARKFLGLELLGRSYTNTLSLAEDTYCTFWYTY